MSHTNSCENISSTSMVNGRTNGHSCPNGDSSPNGAMCSNNEPVPEKDSFCVKSETPCKEISQPEASCNSEMSEIFVNVDEESDEVDTSAEPKARRKYCLFELTTHNTNKHVISKIECETFRNYFRKGDEIISVNSTTSFSFSHTEIVNRFNTEIEDFYKNQSTLVIKVKRVENGITEFITFTYQTTELEKDGPNSKIFESLKLLRTERAFEYRERIPPRIIRLLCYSQQKYLKYNGKDISMEQIDGEKNLHFKFLCTEYQVGSLEVEGIYKYMCCIQYATNKTFLCPCCSKKGIEFKSMKPIGDDISEKTVKVDERFFFRTESKEANDINYFQSVTSKNHYLAYNAVDGLYLKEWKPERTAQIRSEEFEFRLFYIQDS